MLDSIFEGMAWVLAAFFALTNSHGLAIVMLTIAVMAVVTPLTLKGTKSMMAMQQFQPEIRRIQQEHKGDRQALNAELLTFYRENNINPMGSCLPLLIQAPIFIVLFRVIRGLTRRVDGTFDPKYLAKSTELYNSLVGKTKMPFLGIDLSQSALDVLKNENFVHALPYLLIVGVVAGTSYVQQRQVSGRNPGAMTPQQRSLMRIVPLFSVTVAWFPAALGIYWVTSNLCRVGTQSYISRSLYGIKRGQTRSETDGGDGPAPKSGTATTTKNPKPSAGKSTGAGSATGRSQAKASGTAGGSKAANRNGEGATSKARTSGRVTEPKRRPGETSRPPGRPVPGRLGPDAPRPGGTRSERPRRRVPAPPATSASEPAGGDHRDDGTNPPKKRRR